jgi:hypothetical protein
MTTVTVEVEIDLSDISDEDLLQEVRKRGHGATGFADATADLRSGRLQEARIKLERALGWEWIGRLSAT